MKGFLIAGTSSGAGKTTVSLAILAAARRRGLVWQPFKGGPDFLDTSHLTQAAGRPARNVDTWMLSPQANLTLVREAAADAGGILVEGMMGLFDGKSGDSDTGSSAEIARFLKLPVVLVLDASKSARSLAAVVLGFERFDPELPLAGVILNRVASPRHAELLRAAIEARCATPILGSIPREPALTIPERHLGLRTAEESPTPDLEALAAFAEQNLNLDRLFALSSDLTFPAIQPSPTRDTIVRIGIARDEAFTFYYQDNLDLLRQAGADLIPFSPLKDAHLPADLDALYIGGGYPELHATQLAGNLDFLSDLRRFAASNRPIYAECGGMILLAHTLTGLAGQNHPLANVLPLEVEMTAKLNQFGYVTVTLTRDTSLAPAGTVLRGHSFHYSRLRETPAIPTAYHVKYSLSGRQEQEGFLSGNVLASYLHIHFRTAPGLAENLVAAALKSRQESLVSA